jgi:hypothetical protein
MQLNSRVYLNIVLTAIAVLLLALVFQGTRGGLALPEGPATFAYAADDRDAAQRAYLARTAPDQATATATEKVAAANMEIARQVGEMAKGLRALAQSVEKSAAPAK